MGDHDRDDDQDQGDVTKPDYPLCTEATMMPGSPPE